MKKINVSELLANCPQGMELDCVMFEKPVKYMGLTKSGTYIITIKTSYDKVFYLTKEGYLYDMADSKCIIFPKGKTTWEGFVPPCKFKDGDVIALDTEKGAQLFIFKEYIYNQDYVQCYMMLDYDGEIDFEIGDYYVERFATEEEKARLFQVIKDNGYKWNAETKALDELIEPTFKVGNTIQDKDGYKVKITEVNIKDECYGYESVIAKGIGSITFGEQDDWELVPNKFDINTLKPFDSRVLVRDYSYEVWRVSFWGCLINSEHGFKYDTTRGCYKQCIPYEGNEHLLGKTDKCIDFYKIW